MLNLFLDAWLACALLWTAWSGWVLLRAALLGTERLNDVVCRQHPLYLLLGPREPYLRTRLTPRLALASLAIGWVPILNGVLLLLTAAVPVHARLAQRRARRRRAAQNAGA